ncbi:hypothetical protein [Algoriphagus sp.]|uniref:hypothetical protein n=1 Tax=Algoriphagus sp. TaxID=1872435 RepID=UPI00327585AB
MKNILFIGYYFEPYPGVGAKRISYWVNELNRVSNGEFFPTIITATVPTIEVANKTSKFNLIFLADDKKPIFNRYINFDPGYSWYFALKEYLDSLDHFKYECVVLSGNPFLHFYISRYLKIRFKTKIILDFRDPFANNPLFINSILIKKLIKKKLEQLYISYADLVISVNKYCLSLLEINDNSKLLIIENGYDERVISELKPINIDIEYVNFIYTGKISIGRSPKFFLDIVNSNKSFKVHYFGEDSLLLPLHENIIDHSYKSYRDVLSYINACDFCIVISSGLTFESTTKVFDYIALSKPIIVFSSNLIIEGSLYDLSESYKDIYFFNSINSEFLAFIANFKPKDISLDPINYSRLNGLKILINNIKNVTG